VSSGLKLVSTTLAGNSETVIEDALRSVVSWVDLCLVVDTGVTDRTLDVARAVAGEKCVVRAFEWVDDFAIARNFALDTAAEIGGDWSITVDTDERIATMGEDIRATLAEGSEGVLMMMDAPGIYAKERLFRLPARGRFSGPTHEAFLDGESGRRTLERARFVELPKTEEALQAKFARDAELLGTYSAAHPDDPRWLYYLGDAFQNQARHDEALEAFRRCATLRGWNEESAWACYRSAECLLALGRADDAVDACAAGLVRHAGIAELAWLAGFASWQADRPDQAAHWSRLAIAMGRFAGHAREVHRVGFRNPSALYEGPYDVLRFALRALGDDAGADEAERLYSEALTARTESTRA
jgi:hypothetical protein